MDTTTTPFDALPDHQAIAVHLASRAGATYKDVAVQLRQDPRTILRWITAGLQQESSRVRGLGSLTAPK